MYRFCVWLKQSTKYLHGPKTSMSELFLSIQRIYLKGAQGVPTKKRVAEGGKIYTHQSVAAILVHEGQGQMLDKWHYHNLLYREFCLLIKLI